MSSFSVSKEVFDLFYSFNNTLYKAYFQSKVFINEIINLGANGFTQAIYENGDIDFASAIIKSGVSYRPNDLLFGLYSRNHSTFKKHVNDIRFNISRDEYHLSNDILDAMYSNNNIRHYDSFKCFYPPAILANVTKTNCAFYNDKIYRIYKDLFDNGSNTTKNTLEVSAIVALKFPDLRIIAPVTHEPAFKQNLYINISTHNEQKLACLLVFSKFDDLEIGRALHELSHLSTYHLFQNNGNPYNSDNITQIREFNYAAKTMINNIASLMQYNFIHEDIQNISITTSEFKHRLYDNKDILLYSAVYRLDEPVMVDLFSKVFFPNIAMNSNSKSKHIYDLYQSEIITKSASITNKISLERIGDWAIYPNNEVDKELDARFVELHHRFKKLGYNQTLLDSMATYWQDNVSPKVTELKESLGLEECCIWDFDLSSYIIAGTAVIMSTAAIGLTYRFWDFNAPDPDDFICWR